MYVVDDAEYQKVIDKWGKKNPSKSVIGEAFFARAKTMVPITEYDGSFTSPFVLVGRNLLFEEITSLEKI